MSRVRAIAALLITLLPAFSGAEIQIERESAGGADSAAAAQLLRDTLRASPQLTRLNVRVTIGPAAFQKAVAAQDGRPIIATFLTSTEFEETLRGHPRERISAIFSNPDPRDQIALARRLLGRSALCVFDSPATHHLIERLAEQSVQSITATRGQNIGSLLRVADACDAIVALPDSSILNRSNVNHVVRTLYERRKVLIGYSATLTRIGSLASVYVPPDAIARSVVDVLETYADSGFLLAPTFVRDVDVAVNERLARSLNITLPARDPLVEGIRSRSQ